MRFMKMMMAAAVLGFAAMSGQAQAAKLIFAGSATTDSSGNYTFLLPVQSIGYNRVRLLTFPGATGQIITSYTETI